MQSWSATDPSQQVLRQARKLWCEIVCAPKNCGWGEIYGNSVRGKESLEAVMCFLETVRVSFLWLGDDAPPREWGRKTKIFCLFLTSIFFLSFFLQRDFVSGGFPKNLNSWTNKGNGIIKCCLWTVWTSRLCAYRCKHIQISVYCFFPSLWCHHAGGKRYDSIKAHIVLNEALFFVFASVCTIRVVTDAFAATKMHGVETTLQYQC